jgi:hypothetical protein
MTSPCCAPLSRERSSAPRPVAAQTGNTGTVCDLMVEIPGGTFRMGSEAPDTFTEDAEGPVRPVMLSPFRIDAFAVSNDALPSSLMRPVIAPTLSITDGHLYFMVSSRLVPRYCRAE